MVTGARPSANGKLSSYSWAMKRRMGELLPIEESILACGMELASAGEAEFHGFAIARRLCDDRGARQLTAHGTLYKALARLERAGLLAISWEDPDAAVAAGRRAGGSMRSRRLARRRWLTARPRPGRPGDPAPGWPPDDRDRRGGLADRRALDVRRLARAARCWQPAARSAWLRSWPPGLAPASSLRPWYRHRSTSHQARPRSSWCSTPGIGSWPARVS